MIKFKAKTPKSNASRRFFSTFIWVSVIFSATAVATVIVISMLNDCLSLYKRDRVASVKASSLEELADALGREGIVDHPWLFYAYATVKGGAELDGKKVSVSSDMDYRQLLAAFNNGDRVRTIRINFPKGASTDDIIDILVSNGLGSREGFERVINSYPFEYDFVKILDNALPEGRKYRLDGYLYPDTYDFYTGRSEEYYVSRLLDRFETVVKGMGIAPENIDKTVIIASMIQNSAKEVGQYEYVSAVIHNRLNDSGSFPYLDCPATSAYALGEGGVYMGEATEEVKTADTPYNTFTNEGLPPGAICNPDVNALICAARPARSDYKYFVTAENGEVLFAVTEKDHERNLDRVVG